MRKRKRGASGASVGAGKVTGSRESAKKSKSWIFALAGIAILLVLLATLRLSGRKPDLATSKATEAFVQHPTFCRDVAPILYGRCAGCHRPGQSAPFPLLDYASAVKHARQIVSATGKRYMPPWLPMHGYGDFRHNRSLTERQIAILRDWADSGNPEGDRGDLPQAPEFTDGWALGKPDLVVVMPQKFTVPAEGRDVYRNLVFPIPLDRSRYVQAVEFHPGNPLILHHAFVNVDETRGSRRLAERQDPPGFDGMELPPTATMPGGQFLSWQPGRLPEPAPPGLSWLLRTNTDLVLQLHLHPSGKPETIQPSVGFFFTDEPPTNTAFRLALKSFELDIPPAESNYVVEESYKLPVDLSVLRVETHAHYLAREMKAWATLPGGEERPLIWIKNWDFNWQGGYDYESPFTLPQGTTVSMRYVYDNSTNNVRNPRTPPARVRFGVQTTDEMAELWLQVLAANARERSVLAQNYFSYLGQKTMHFDEFRLSLDPSNVDAHVRLAHNYLMGGQAQRAFEHLQRAIQLQPGDARAHHEMANLYLGSNKMTEAAKEFQATVQLDPSDSEAYGNLGYIYAKMGLNLQAREALRAAVRLNPDDVQAARLLASLGNR